MTWIEAEKGKDYPGATGIKRDPETGKKFVEVAGAGGAGAEAQSGAEARTEAEPKAAKASKK